MGNIRYTAPKGLDREIDMLQVRLYDYLILKGWTSYNCYPRAYVNTKGKTAVIEYSVNSKDYQEILLNDKINASSFFILTSSNKKDLRLEKANLSLIFQINLSKIKTAITSRIADEDVINNITTFLFKQPYSIRLLNVKRGVKNVYSDLNVEMSTRNEMSEFLVCRFDMELFYTLNEPGTKTNQII
jgi:hypothetical protein